MTSFHDKTFDPGTQLKLELFRGYIREWIPVFLTRSTKYRPSSINFYDFFSGPGYDAEHNPGSPLIIIDELKQYCTSNLKLKAAIEVNMHFNDVSKKNIRQLEGAVRDNQCECGCCSIHFTSAPFTDALKKELEDIEANDSANLIIMDQFGVKEVTPQIVRTLAHCRQTDILFFISSAFIKRFIDTPEFSSSFKDLAGEVKNSEYKAIHRVICDYYREKLGDLDYYLAPFSIRKGANIYGVIFGSRNLLGLEKFLKVCWTLDPVTGESNYDIDGDIGARSRSPQMFLSKDFYRVKKIDVFRADLEDFISTNSPNNHDVYKFSLHKGFSSAKACEALRELQNDGKLIVTDYNTGFEKRKNVFYISYDNFKDVPKARFEIR